MVARKWQGGPSTCAARGRPGLLLENMAIIAIFRRKDRPAKRVLSSADLGCPSLFLEGRHVDIRPSRQGCGRQADRGGGSARPSPHARNLAGANRDLERAAHRL